MESGVEKHKGVEVNHEKEGETKASIVGSDLAFLVKVKETFGLSIGVHVRCIGHRHKDSAGAHAGNALHAKGTKSWRKGRIL